MIFFSPCSLTGSIISSFSSSAKVCIRLSEWRGAWGRRPLAGGMPRMPQMAVVRPRSMISNAKPLGLRVRKRWAVHMMVLISWSKKKRMVTMAPESIETAM